MAYSHTHRKLLSFKDTNTTIQTCLDFCDDSHQNDTATASPSGFCPPTCMAICPSTCRYSLSSILPPDTSPPQLNTHHNLSPLLITMLIVLASAFLLITSYVFYIKLYYHFYNPSHNHNNIRRRRREVGRGDNDMLDEEHVQHAVVFHPFWYVPTVGLNPTVISSIEIIQYKKEMDERDCAVCLAEFDQGDDLKVLPKCNHAFHVSCIDKWLKSHVNCPLCRAPVVAPSDGDGDHVREREQMVVDSAAATRSTVGGSVENDRPIEDGGENNLEGGLENAKEKSLENERGENDNKGSSSSQRWSVEGARRESFVSRSLSCGAKIFLSRYTNNKHSPNS